MFFTVVDYPISDIELSVVLGFIFHGFNANNNYRNKLYRRRFQNLTPEIFFSNDELHTILKELIKCKDCEIFFSYSRNYLLNQP